MTMLSLLTGIAVAATAQAPLAVKPIKTVQGVRPIALVAGPTGTKFAASLENSTIRVYDVVNLKVLRVLSGHPQPAYAIAFHPKGQILASGDESARIYLWDLKTGKKIREMRTHIRGIQNLSFDSTGTRLVSTGKDDVVKIYDTKTGKELRSIPGNGANFYSATYLPGGAFAVGTLSDGVRVYGAQGVARKYGGHADGAVWDFDFNVKTNRMVTGGRDSNAIAHDYKGAKKIQTFRGHGDWVNSVALTPNGRFAFTASTDRTIRYWDMKSNRLVGMIENMTSVGSPMAITANGQYLVGVNLDDWMQIFELKPVQAAVKK
jgi:WD40 repeat protein